MTFIRKIYLDADRIESIDSTFNSLEEALKDLNTFNDETVENIVYWPYGFSIFDENGVMIMDAVYPPSN